MKISPLDILVAIFAWGALVAYGFAILFILASICCLVGFGVYNIVAPDAHIIFKFMFSGAIFFVVITCILKEGCE